MNLADLGVSVTSAATSTVWGRVKGVGRVADGANRLFLGLGATPVRAAPLPTGAKLLLDLRSPGQWQYYYTRDYDGYWIGVCNALLDPDTLFMDVGANIGGYAVQVAVSQRIEDQCYCYEPLPGNLARLHQNIALNGVGAFVKVHDFGLSDAPATLPLALVSVEGGEDTCNAEIVMPGIDDPRPRVEIEVRRLDDSALPDRRIGVMKIDVEGHEDYVYRGGRERFAKDRPFIVAEYNRMLLEKHGLSPQWNFGAELPADYVALRKHDGRLVPVTDWMELHKLDNVLLCPAEGVERAKAVRL
jgi:FkbM family methyltransferase